MSSSRIAVADNAFATGIDTPVVGDGVEANISNGKRSKTPRVKRQPNPDVVQRLAKIEIVKPLNCSWKTAGDVLRSVESACINMANLTVTSCLSRDREAFASIIYDTDGKRKMPVKSTKKADGNDGEGEVPEIIKLNLPPMDDAENTEEYHLLRKLYPHVSSNIASVVSQTVKKKYIQTRTQVLTGKRSVECYRNYSIPIHNQRWRMTKTEHLLNNKSVANYTIRCSLLSKEATGFVDNHGEPLAYIDFALRTSKIRGFEQQAFDIFAALPINELTGSERIRKEIKIKFNGRAKKWMALIPYNRKKEDRDLIADRVMLVAPYKKNNIVSCYCDMPNSRPFVDDIECTSVIKFNTYFMRHRNEINTKYRQGNNAPRRFRGGSVGHGRKRALRKSEQLRISYNNMSECYNRQKASYIVKLAIRWRCGKIHMMNLSELDRSSLALHDWRYADMQKYISDLCEENRIEFKLFSSEHLQKFQDKFLAMQALESDEDHAQAKILETGEAIVDMAGARVCA